MGIAVAVKQEVIQLVTRMPDDCTVSDILYELYLKQKVDQGLQDVEEGQVIPHDEVEQRMSRWLK